MLTLPARTAVASLVVAAAVLSTGATTGAAAGPSHARPVSAVQSTHFHHFPAWIDVSVAQLWVSPKAPRPMDRRMLRNPVNVNSWVKSLSPQDRYGLHGRATTQALLGDRVVVVGARGAWREVRVVGQRGNFFPTGIIGWLPAHLISSSPLPVTRKMVSVTSKRAPLRRLGQSLRAPGPQLSYATQLPYAGSRRHQVLVDVPGRHRAGWLPKRDVSIHRVTKPAIAPTPHHVVHQILQFRGLPFLWSGMSSFGFDCAGIVSTIYRQFGVHLARDAADQARQGKPVARHHLRAGDVVFFSSNGTLPGIHHAAIYIGHGRIAQSPFTGMTVSTAKLAGYDSSQYWGARRYIH